MPRYKARFDPSGRRCPPYGDKQTARLPEYTAGRTQQSAARARVSGVQSKCKRTFFWGGWQKIVAQIRGVFRKIIIYYPPGGQISAPEHLFTPNFCLHTVTTGSGFRNFGNSLRNFHLLTEIYPMVPFPSSLGVGISDYTPTPLRWAPLTRARPRA